MRELAKAKAEFEVEDGGAERAAGALVQKWAAWLSVALHRANAAVLWSALGSEREAVAEHRELAAELAG